MSNKQPKAPQEKKLVSDQVSKAKQMENSIRERKNDSRDPGHPYEHHGARVSDKRSHR